MKKDDLDNRIKESEASCRQLKADLASRRGKIARVKAALRALADVDAVTDPALKIVR